MGREDSGRIRLDGDTVKYASSMYGSWELPVSALRIVGECTNQDGPGADDWLLVFVTGPEGWYEASFYAEGRTAFLAALAERLETKLECKLVFSADFASNVLWPEDLAGSPLFSYTPEPPKGRFDKFMRSIGLAFPDVIHTYTDEIRERLRNPSPSANPRD